MARTVTPAISTCGGALSHRLQIPRRTPCRGGRHEDEMIEHGASRLPDAQSVDQGRWRAAGQAVGQEGGALRALLAVAAKPVSCRTGPISARRGFEPSRICRSAGVPPGQENLVGRGCGTASCRPPSRRPRYRHRWPPHAAARRPLKQRGHAALEERRLVIVPGEKGNLAVECAGGPPPDRAAACRRCRRPPALLHRDTGGERAAELEQHERRLDPDLARRRSHWSWIPSAAAHSLSAVPRSTRLSLRCAGTVSR